MIKKSIMFIFVLMLCTALCICVYADYLGKVEAEKVTYPIIVDGEKINEEIPMVMIEDRIYIPVRSLCDALDFEIEWYDEGRVEITTNNTESYEIEFGFYGVNGWEGSPQTITVKKREMSGEEITEEDAIAIADDIFLELYGEEFINTTTVKAKVTDDKESYSVYRCKEPLEPGGTLEIIIRKSDGKVLRGVLGE